MSSSSASSCLNHNEVDELAGVVVSVLALVVVVVWFALFLVLVVVWFVLALVVVVVVVLGPLVVVVYAMYWFWLHYMCAAKSKREKEGTTNNQDHYYDREREGDSNNNESSSSSGGRTALAVGAAALLIGVAWGSTALAVGTALLVGVVVWVVSRYRSKKSESFKTMPGRKSTVKILTYNVCSREDYAAIHVRMKAIGDLVQLHSPHFICFQEITPSIFNIFQRSSWWSDYYCPMSTEEASKKQYFCILLLSKSPLVIPVSTFTAPLSMMGKELCVTETRIGTNKSLVVATSHLKSRNYNPNDPTSQHHQFKKQRSDQAKEALAILENYPNVIFGGDMNWDEKMDGEFPLPEGWIDAWTELKGEEEGNTFDTKSNMMLKGRWPTVQMRFDRILCNLKGFELEKIEIVGKEPIPDQWTNKKLPVVPSDHYGLLLTVCT